MGHGLGLREPMLRFRWANALVLLVEGLNSDGSRSRLMGQGLSLDVPRLRF